MEPIEKICPLRENENENDWGRRYLRHECVGLVAQSYLYDHSESLLDQTVPILVINLQSSILFETQAPICDILHDKSTCNNVSDGKRELFRRSLALWLWVR